MVIGNHVPDVYAEILQVGGLPAGGSCYHGSMWLVSYNESYVCYLECSRR